MSLEIYYTSAPEGLKRGSSGFCTVAASDNIPKALADRLEALSAYRHHFGAGSPQNPTSHAHWILNVAGKTHHVLSRVCDSGVDHTQRTNAFAHHLVVENPEMEAALGGPAWMLDQPGVMADLWDGRVGALQRGRLPKGDIFSPSRICTAWAAITGDAGWGGHLADLFARTPTRPVCILYAPGQEMLPLLAEAIALLPPAARWNVTFNTYFTSMPTSATCLWRCCLAGTPAAQVALRYAASGLILDLTEPARLSLPPPGPYLTMARTGQAPEATQPSSARAAAKAVRPKEPASSSAKPKLPVPASPDTFDEDLQVPNYAVYDLVPPTAQPLDPQSEAPPLVPATQSSAPTAAARAAASQRRRMEQTTLPATMRQAELALDEAERQANRAAQQRRRQILMLFGAALGAIGVGSGLIYWAHRDTAPPEPPPPVPHTPAPSAARPVTHGTPEAALTPTSKPTAPPQEPAPVIAQSQPITPAPPVPVPVTFPDSITATAALERPKAGTGIGDWMQTISLRPGDLNNPGGVTTLRIHFPKAQATPVTGGSASPAADPNAYTDESLGTLSAHDEKRSGKNGIALRWKAKSDPSPPAEALFIAFDSARPALEYHWHTAALLTRPEMVNFLYWMLQNSSITLQNNAGIGQHILMKPFDAGPILLDQALSAVPWPCDMPRETTVIPPPAAALPQGAGHVWQATWYTDWEEKDAALRSTENASQVIKFKRPTSTAAVDAWFLLTFRPGLNKVESTFARRLASDRADLTQFQSDLRAIDSQMGEVKTNNNGVLGNSPGAQELLAKRDQTQALINAYKEAIAGYNELTTLDVGFELPDGVRLATLRFQRHDKADPGK